MPDYRLRKMRAAYDDPLATLAEANRRYDRIFQGNDDWPPAWTQEPFMAHGHRSLLAYIEQERADQRRHIRNLVFEMRQRCDDCGGVHSDGSVCQPLEPTDESLWGV